MKELKKEILIGLTAGIIIVIAINLTQPEAFFSIAQFFDFGELGFEINDDFEVFALTINFLYEIIPQSAQLISVGAIGTVLLQRGFNPFVFGLVIGAGKLTGQMTLYTIARVIRHKGKWGDNSTVNHWLHKYHFLVFFFPAWTGTLGDIIMLYAGHQKISPIRIIPILFTSNVLEAYRWIFPQMGQLEIIDGIGG